MASRTSADTFCPLPCSEEFAAADPEADAVENVALSLARPQVAGLYDDFLRFAVSWRFCRALVSALLAFLLYRM